MKLLSTIGIIFLFSLVFCHTIEEFRCGDSFKQVGDQKCYKDFADKQADNDETVTLCSGAELTNQYHPTLLTIRSKTQQRQVLSYLSGRAGRVWLGARLNNQTGRFEWTADGTPLVYANWAPNSPTNGSSTNDCVVLDTKTGHWLDVGCASKAQVVCEKTIFMTFPELQLMFFELRELLEYKSQQLRDALQAKDRLIGQLAKSMDAVNHKLESVSNQIDDFSDHFAGYVNKSLDRLKGDNQELSGDILDLKDITDRLTDGLLALHDECSAGCGGGGGGVTSKDLEALRKELLAKLTEKFDPLSAKVADLVEDVKLEIVSYRRTLRMKKGGKWHDLGHV
ncbi:uncharacterized protein LOC128959908 [Oppia nitens]|uniref:uncharacterized protein LOC128959908 n=1 Tax=Oppia nitens TaxID=1686743 RepID=UPI0023DAA5B6|nr:uncharacterized protein LOC128959908 [Oppia nitens]